MKKVIISSLFMSFALCLAFVLFNDNNSNENSLSNQFSCQAAQSSYLQSGDMLAKLDMNTQLINFTSEGSTVEFGRSTGCSTGCSVSCSVSCSVGCSSGCSSGCSVGCRSW